VRQLDKEKKEAEMQYKKKDESNGQGRIDEKETGEAQSRGRIPRPGGRSICHEAKIKNSRKNSRNEISSLRI
jgi:hypothetical protein